MDQQTKQYSIICCTLLIGFITTIVSLTVYGINYTENQAEQVKLGMLNGYSQQYIQNVGVIWVRNESE